MQEFDVLTSIELERGIKALQFDVCCEAVLWLCSHKGISKFAIISKSKQKFLKSSLVHIAWITILTQDMAFQS